MYGCQKRLSPKVHIWASLFWNAFQNDLTKAIMEAEISMYADDNQIFSSDHSTGRVQEKLMY